jgi:N-acetylglucosaminyl-diphospho-decaprenol L-rhamnosyltransferase
VKREWAAVVVAYDSGPLLLDCVRSLLSDDSAGAPPVVVVVDNFVSSKPGESVAQIEAEFPSVSVIRPGANLGYARAANLGIAATKAEIVAVINPDAILVAGSAAGVMDRFQSEPTLGALGPKIREANGEIYPSARSVPSNLDALGHALFGSIRPNNKATRRYRELDRDPEVARHVDWVSGAAVWLRREALNQIGGWDEAYFMYVEDVDLCWRLKGAGWGVGYSPSAQVTHVQGVSTGRTPFRMIAAHHRSAFRFANKRWSGAKRVLLAPTALLLSLRCGVAMLSQLVRHPRASVRVP